MLLAQLVVNRLACKIKVSWSVRRAASIKAATLGQSQPYSLAAVTAISHVSSVAKREKNIRSKVFKVPVLIKYFLNTV